MPHERGDVAVAIREAYEHGLQKHGEYSSWRDGVDRIIARCEMLRKVSYQVHDADRMYSLTKTCNQLAGMCMKYVCQFGTEPMPAVMGFRPEPSSANTDPPPKGEAVT